MDKLIYLGQAPELHLLIEAFFSGLKSLLDLSVQLLSTEGVVTVGVHGFHRDKSVYGGVVLNALERNVGKEKRETAAAITQLIRNHKQQWIDAAIGARDLLVHPVRGQQQLMFELHLAERGAELAIRAVVPPHVGDVPIPQYARQQATNIRDFSKAFMSELRPSKP